MFTAYDPLKEFFRRATGEALDLSLWTAWEQIILDTDQSRIRQLLAQILHKAEAGSMPAMCMSAAYLRSKEGGLRQYKEAAVWAARAAELECPPGIFELGACYENGVGVPQNYGQAYKLYEEAAASGYGHAALTLAIRYQLGQGFSVEPSKALDYIMKAIDLGDTYAPYELATWFEHGTGVNIDFSVARHWYAAAAEGGNEFACARLGTAYSLGGLGLEPDSEMARKYYELHDESGPT